MKNKWPLFAGLTLLAVGIILKIILDNVAFPVFLIVTGILFKVCFVFNKIETKEYQPGYELILLILGLGLFFSGIHLKNPVYFIEPGYLKIVGILFKIGFIILFIRKTSRY
ncbi:MAG: hypothetical protein ACOCWD_02430 [Tangfeifania sp.]